MNDNVLYETIKNYFITGHYKLTTVQNPLILQLLAFLRMTKWTSGKMDEERKDYLRENQTMSTIDGHDIERKLGTVLMQLDSVESNGQILKWASEFRMMKTI